MSDELIDLIAKMFIARPDAKAIQMDAGHYVLHEDWKTKERFPWTREDLELHLSGQRSYGHYLLNTDSKCKLFAFDVDLEKNKVTPEGNVTWTGQYPHPFAWDDSNNFAGKILDFDAREAWTDRAHPSRAWTKMQLRSIAQIFVRAIEKELGIKAAAAYSGAKGIHIYGFTGLYPACDAREGAQIILDSIGGWEPSKGSNFFRSMNTDPIDGFPNLTIEVFPKQDTLDGKDLGNLMRLPLGRNKKSEDPTFFIDMTSSLTDLLPVDPIHALTQSPWVPSSDATRNGQLVAAG